MGRRIVEAVWNDRGRRSSRGGGWNRERTYAVLKTIAAFLNTEGGDLLLGVATTGRSSASSTTGSRTTTSSCVTWSR